MTLDSYFSTAIGITQTSLLVFIDFIISNNSNDK